MSIAAIGATHPTDISITPPTPYAERRIAHGTPVNPTLVGDPSHQAGETEISQDGEPIVAPAEVSATRF